MITKKDEKFIIKWKNVKRDGKKKYLNKNSTIMGVTMFAGFLVNKLAKGNTIDQKEELTRSLGVLLGGLMGGMIGGLISWNSKEKKFNKLTSKNK